MKVNSTCSYCTRIPPGLIYSDGAHAKEVLGSQAVNGEYWYIFPSGPKKLWTDFTSYAPLVFVMVTRIKNDSQDQYKTEEVGAVDLARTPSRDSPPERMAKLSDDDMNHIITAGTARCGVCQELVKGMTSCLWRAVQSGRCWFRERSGGFVTFVCLVSLLLLG